MNEYLDFIVLSGLFLLAFALIYIRIMRRRPPWWAAFVTKENMFSSWGSVYAVYCPEVGPIEKVGTTQRKVYDRMKEIARDMTGYRVRLHFALDHMPFSWAVEQEAHRILKRKRIVFPKGSKMGVEWVSCRDDEELGEIVEAIQQAAKAVRYYAVSVGCWPKNAKPVIVDFRSGKMRKTYIFTKENSPGLKIAS